MLLTAAAAVTVATVTAVFFVGPDRSLPQLLGLAIVQFFVVISAFVIALRRWVVVPLHRLSAALESQNLDEIGLLALNPTEFGKFARLILLFFAQKHALEREIGERKLLEEKLKTLATHDSLTGLPNRALFDDRLGMALSLATRSKQIIGVMMIDMDYFKDINDTLGHAAGDEYLRTVAERLELCVRKCDTAARLGGDEFVILLNQISSCDDVLIVARRIVDAFREPLTIGGASRRATFSMGISLFPLHAQCATELLKLADDAMYRVKKNGRDGYCVWTKDDSLDMHEAEQERVRTKTEVHRLSDLLAPGTRPN
jgi:diguanylate cyclase (GGDEF)-like protein